MYPNFVEIDNEKFEINTDFRIALKCNAIATQNNVSDTEKALAIIFLLYGEKGLKSHAYYSKLMELGLKYLSCGKELKKSDKEPDMDYEQDMSYIEASFMSDYNIDLENTKMHWWKFNNLMNGLSYSEIGNCCVLNRIRHIRTMSTKGITDRQTLKEIAEQKKFFALKKKGPNQKQLESAKQFQELLGKGNLNGETR